MRNADVAGTRLLFHHVRYIEMLSNPISSFLAQLHVLLTSVSKLPFHVTQEDVRCIALFALPTKFHDLASYTDGMPNTDMLAT